MIGFLVDKLHQHFENASLIGNRERHFRLIEQKHGAVGEAGERFVKQREHHLAVARYLDELLHFRLMVK